MSTPIDSTGVLGDRWSTFILSAAFTGSRRFHEFQEKLGISPVTLTQRLNLFFESGLMHRQEAANGKHQEYRLTTKALDFFDVTTTINSWAERWLSENDDSGLALFHIPCKEKIIPRFTCNACNGVLTRKEIYFEGGPIDSSIEANVQTSVN